MANIKFMVIYLTILPACLLNFAGSGVNHVLRHPGSSD